MVASRGRYDSFVHSAVAAVGLWACGCAAGPSLPRLATAADLEPGLAVASRELDAYGAAAVGLAATATAMAGREFEAVRGELEADRRAAAARSEREIAALRTRAIGLLEALAEADPDDPALSPWALLATAELSFEDESARYEAAFEQHERDATLGTHAEGSEPSEPVLDHGRSLATLRELLARFPGWERMDEALSLLGFASSEVGQAEEALSAWLQLVCPSRFRYRAGQAQADLLGAGSALALDGCEHAGPLAPLEHETWVRIGDAFFDYGLPPASLETAIDAYGRAMAAEDGQYFGVALYKQAWAQYRSDRYREAIRGFARLIERADGASRPGPSIDRDLRAEAVQYIAIALAEEDWDGDGAADSARAIDRLRDPQLLAQDRSHLAEVSSAVADVLFDLTRYPEAIEVYELVLARWPGHDLAAHAARRIGEARSRAQDPATVTPAEPRRTALLARPRTRRGPAAVPGAYRHLFRALAANRDLERAACAARWTAEALERLARGSRQQLAAAGSLRLARPLALPVASPRPARTAEARPELAAVVAALEAYDDRRQALRAETQAMLARQRELELEIEATTEGLRSAELDIGSDLQRPTPVILDRTRLRIGPAPDPGAAQ